MKTLTPEAALSRREFIARSGALDEDEIATLRARLDTVLREQPEDLKLALDAMNTLLRMVVADYRLSPRASKDLADSVAAVLNSFADQLVPSDR